MRQFLKNYLFTTIWLGAMCLIGWFLAAGLVLLAQVIGANGVFILLLAVIIGLIAAFITAVMAND
jgi:hypothetical protein